jgi:hypothetical protein
LTVDAIYQSHNWTNRSYRLETLITPSALMRIKVRAEDLGAGDSQVKAAVDNFAVEAVVCTAAPFGDLDGDRLVGGGDLSVLLLEFGICDGSIADLDQSGCVDSGDVAVLLLSYS